MELKGEWGRNAAQQIKNNPDVLQPFKKDGTINKDFVQAHGTKTLEKEHKTTRQAIMDEVENYG